MRKILIVCISVLSLFGFNAFSANTVNTSKFFVGDNKGSVITIKQALKLSDETPVVLEGYIARQIGDNDFIFKDSTGEIEIDIDDNIIRQYANAEISEETLLRIQGVVDKELMEDTKIEVFKLDIVKTK